MHEVPTERQESELARETYHAMRMVWWGVRGKMQAPRRDVIVGGIRQHKLKLCLTEVHAGRTLLVLVLVLPHLDLI